MSSEARRAANRRNAQKSTGPKTEAGKAKSRRNALKHGLSGAGIVLRRRDEKKLARRINDWRETLAPIGPIEDSLVERAALAAVRCESAVQQEAAERHRRIGKALSRFECKKRNEISELVALLNQDPHAAGRSLKKLRRGLAWMISAWRKLARELRAQGFWTHESAGLALRLLGKEPLMPYPGNAEVLAFRKAFLGALREVDLDEAEALLELDGSNAEPGTREAALNAALLEQKAALAALRGVVAESLRRLRKRQHELPEDRNEFRERAEVIACSQIGTDTGAYRLHRYEVAQEMSLHRNLNELIRIRKQEPDMASIARWEKTGKKYNRRWDGYGWVPNAEWRLDVDDQTECARVAGFSALREPGASEAKLEPVSGLLPPEPVTASGGSLRSTPGTRPDGHVEGKEEADLAGDGPVTVTGPSLRSDPGTRSEAVLSGEEAPPRLPGAESKTMPRLPASEADKPRAGICSDEQPLSWVPGVERSDPPDTVIRSEQASSRGPDHEPPGDGTSSTACPGQDPAEVWPGLSAACPGTPQPKHEPLENSGLLAQEPVTATGGSLCSTPGTRSEGHLEGGAEAGLAGHEPMTVSGSSRCSDPGTRSEGYFGAREEPGLAADESVRVTGASADAVAPATPSGAVWEGKQRPGLPADGHVMVTGPSLRSDPGTRSGADSSAESLDSQATTRVAGFSAWREPGAPEAKREPAEKAMTDGRWLMTENTGRPEGKLDPAEPACDSESALVSHPSSAISHSPSAPVSHPNQAQQNEANASERNLSQPPSSAKSQTRLETGSNGHPHQPDPLSPHPSDGCLENL